MCLGAHATARKKSGIDTPKKASIKTVPPPKKETPKDADKKTVEKKVADKKVGEKKDDEKKVEKKEGEKKDESKCLAQTVFACFRDLIASALQLFGIGRVEIDISVTILTFYKFYWYQSTCDQIPRYRYQFFAFVINTRK